MYVDNAARAVKHHSCAQILKPGDVMITKFVVENTGNKKMQCYKI
jgi:hypothetical protein